MNTYASLKKEAESLDRKIAVAFAIERTAKINELIMSMREYKITAEDLGHNLKPMPKWVNVKTGDTWCGRGKSPAWVIGEDASPCNSMPASFYVSG